MFLFVCLFKRLTSKVHATLKTYNMEPTHIQDLGYKIIWFTQDLKECEAINYDTFDEVKKLFQHWTGN